MDLLQNLALGFSTALQPVNILYCFLGVVLGTLIGVLPGIGPVATIAMLLPVTVGLTPTASLIMLAGIYYGSQYGGSTTAILINLPGETASAVTTIDGYQMARRGRAGPALVAAALGSVIAGTIATVIVAMLAKPLTVAAISFGPPEYFSLLALGLAFSITLASGSVVKAMGMLCLGLLLGLTGTDVNTGAHRFTFGASELLDGFDFVAIAVGAFGVGEILRNLESSHARSVVTSRIEGLWPSPDDLRRIVPPALRGTAVGSFLGILPGGGALLSSFIAYSLEKRVSRNSAEFGKGAIEGVAAPEAANNAAAQTSFIPMLSLGVPSNVVMALMIGALIIQGIQPGPNVIRSNPDLFWGLIASMWLGNAFLVVLNLPLIGIWVRLLRVPYNIMFPAIMAFCCVGGYSVSSSTLDVYQIALFGVAGYFFLKLNCQLAPFILGFILGPMLEEHLRRALVISGGDPLVFVTRPISAVLLSLAVFALIFVSLPAMLKRRDEVFEEED